ncbi:unnamed protein product [Dicrocoelium dendriticum]|nr:unnamed protein product [Dicrocoelium dendriticum]
MRHFSLSTCSKDPNLAVYIPGQKGQPSFVRIYQWRDGQCGQIANRSFYRADAVQLFWNDRGTDLLVLASTKMSDESYYGDQSLYYLTTRKSTNSAVVTMPRKGPIYQVAWKPSPSNSNRRSSEEFFAVCHGDVPASVTVFGLECEPVFDFGAGSWNQIHFNPHGNLILAAGLGGMNGDIAVWDFDRHELLSRFSTTDVTNISWLNDGEHLILATTTPRLRVNNSFGIWHYSGKKLYFQRVARRAVPRPATMDLPAATEHELYRIQVVPQLKLPPAPKPKKFSTSVELPAAPKKYVPPALRNRSEVAKQAMAAAHMEDTMKLTYRPPIASTLPIGLNSSALNPGKKSKSTKCKTKMSSTGSAPAADTSTMKAPSASAEDRACQSDEQLQRTKQIAQLKKKLIQIEKLKAEQASGKQLAFNQLDKLATEEELRAHLNRLSVSSGDTANCV